MFEDYGKIRYKVMLNSWNHKLHVFIFILGQDQISNNTQTADKRYIMLEVVAYMYAKYNICFGASSLYP